MNSQLSRLNPDRKLFFTIHDSTTVYSLVGVLAVGVFLFSLSGLQIAWTTPVYLSYAWVPGLLLMGSSVLIISCGVRIVRRMIFALQDRLEAGEGFPL